MQEKVEKAFGYQPLASSFWPLAKFIENYSLPAKHQ